VSTVPRIAVTPDFLAARQLETDQVQDLLKLQKAAQKITSILDLDELIDQVVNDIACSFGCLEACLYLHDEPRAELVMAGVKGCTVHDKGERLKIGKEVWSVMLPPPVRCATPPMSARILITWPAKPARFPKWPFPCWWDRIW
jgi:hypothetical protein